MQSNLLSHGEEQRNGDGKRKRLKISVAHFDNSALIKTYSKTLIGRCMNPVEQEMKALFTNLPKIWKLEERVTGSDLGFGKFQFDFMTEEELEAVLRHQPYHFDYWMLALAKWQPKQLKDFPSEIPFWIRVFGLPLEFRTAPTLESIGGALGRVVDVDVVQNRVQVVIDAFKELCFETSIDFKGGEFYEEEEVAVSLRYEKLFGYCKGCGSLCHKEEICPLDEKNTKAEPERRRENREGNGGWTDGAKHEERARSYKGVVINGSTGQQNRERDSKEYYGKGKGKMGEAPDSKWVKVPERGNRRSYNHHGNYRGNGEGSRVKTTYREAVPVVGSGTQGVSYKTYPLQRREDQGQQQDIHPAREEGEITMNEDADAALPSAEFQMELAKTQAEGSEVVVEAMEEERSLLAVQGMMEKHDEPFDDIEMEIDAINAAMMASGVDLEAEEEFQTLSEEEFEQDSEAQIENALLQNAEEPVAGDANINKELEAGEMAMRQGHRKRLFKPNSSTAGSTKMRMASALLSPRKKIAAKVGTRHGDNTKPPESKGPSIPKPVNLKF
ncbi:uncharacterized protein LOC108870222 [Brassica rapa]|uniref:uncharacterized protein LOC108870222 n=1 Tax=Brassica campestris TaxID=3711 RepID=UPI000872F9A9|nr:uncharacterized protein LOC108870222 [Brassica rapa]